MRKLMILALLAVTMLTANAATRKWDFRSWSSATIANLKAGAGQANPSSNWSDIEKATNSAPTDLSKESCYWEVAAKGDATKGATLQANGQNIAELEGLLYTNTTARSLAIAVNYQNASATDAAFRNYQGPCYIWLGSKQKNYFVIPNVKAGATIKMGVESHKTSEGRGVELYVVAKGVYGTKGTKLTDPEGNAVAAPKTYEDQTWVLPAEGLTDKANEDGTYDVMIYNTNGCHVYYITVEEGGDAEVDKNVAWVSANPEGDMNKVLAPTTGITYTDIAAASEISADSLRTFDAVVISTDVDADTPMGKLLAENIAFMPMVNLNTNLFGYTPADVANSSLTAVNKDNDIFTGVDIAEDGTFEYAAVGVALPERFADDDILAKNGDAVAFHQHTAKRNSYILLASDAEFSAAQTAAWPTLLANAINTVAASKKKVTQVAAPVISQKYEEGKTTVTITCSTAGSKIQYAIGEGEFQAYTEPITMTAEGTVYAIASAEGYLPITEEEAVSADIKVYTKAAQPTISYTQAEGVAYITMTAEEGATVYYNFVGSSAEAESVAYTDTITLSENATITAFAKKEGYLNSDPVNQLVEIEGLKLMDKVLGHFDANKTQWSNGESKAYYYCYGYDDGTGTKYKKYNTSIGHTVTYAPEGSDWTLKTSGQQVVWESTSPQKKVGDTSNYNPVSITDLIGNEITGGEITVGAVSSHEETLKDSEGNDSIATVNDPQSFELISNIKFQAPFNIVSYIGCKPEKVGFEYYVSTDGENWESIATSPAGPTYTDGASKWRLWHRDVISYTGTDEVYLKVKSISNDSYRIFDIFIKGESENTAIKDIATEASEKTSIRKVFNNGQILIQTPAGTFNAVGARVK